MDRHQQRAKRVIVSFKQQLGSELAGEILEEKCRDLALMVGEVIAEADRSERGM